MTSLDVLHEQIRKRMIAAANKEVALMPAPLLRRERQAEAAFNAALQAFLSGSYSLAQMEAIVAEWADAHGAVIAERYRQKMEAVKKEGLSCLQEVRRAVDEETARVMDAADVLRAHIFSQGR